MNLTSKTELEKANDNILENNKIIDDLREENSRLAKVEKEYETFKTKHINCEANINGKVNEIIEIKQKIADMVFFLVIIGKNNS